MKKTSPVVVSEIRADPQVMDLIQVAQKAAAFDVLCDMMLQKAALERDLQDLHKSRAKDVDLRRLHLDGRLQQVRDMLEQMRLRFAP